MNNTNYIAHYGMPRRSGRYPWGSGEKGRQRRLKNSYNFRKSKKYKEATKEERLNMSRNIIKAQRYSFGKKSQNRTAYKIMEEGKDPNKLAKINKIKGIATIGAIMASPAAMGLGKNISIILNST